MNSGINIHLHLPRLGLLEPLPRESFCLLSGRQRQQKADLSCCGYCKLQGVADGLHQMLGVTLADLPLCRAPLDEIKNRSFLVFAALARAQFALVHTMAPNGEQDKLVIPITKFCPNLSTWRD